MKIECDLTEPYAESIALFIKREFPILAKHGDLLELLTDAIIASGQIRLGPRPSPESLVAIREVITHWISKGEPIPFLIGWGSEKPDGSGIDIAELMAMKTLSCLHHRVSQYYHPGVVFSIRVEDASAPHLFFDRKEQARIEAAHYTAGFVNLARTLGINSFVKITPELSMISEETFNHKADEVLPAMEAHVENPTDEIVREYLLKFGWKVPLSFETIGYYLERTPSSIPIKTKRLAIICSPVILLGRLLGTLLESLGLASLGMANSWNCPLSNQRRELVFIGHYGGFTTAPCLATSPATTFQLGGQKDFFGLPTKYLPL